MKALTSNSFAALADNNSPTFQCWYVLRYLVHLIFSFIHKVYTRLCKNNHIISVLYTLDKVHVNFMHHMQALLIQQCKTTANQFTVYLQKCKSVCQFQGQGFTTVTLLERTCVGRISNGYCNAGKWVLSWDMTGQKTCHWITRFYLWCFVIFQQMTSLLQKT
jgi:hypothetical protein